MTHDHIFIYYSLICIYIYMYYSLIYIYILFINIYIYLYIYRHMCFLTGFIPVPQRNSTVASAEGPHFKSAAVRSPPWNVWKIQGTSNVTIRPNKWGALENFRIPSTSITRMRRDWADLIGLRKDDFLRFELVHLLMSIPDETKPWLMNCGGSPK